MTPRRVPIALVLAVAMLAIAIVGQHYEYAVAWTGPGYRREIDITGVLVYSAMALGWMSPVAFAVGAWQLHGRATVPWRRVLLAIASIAAWSLLAMSNLQTAVMGWLIVHDDLDAIRNAIGHAVAVVVLAYGVAFAVGTERRLAIGIGSLLALVPVAYRLFHGPGDTPIAVVVDLVAPVVMLALVVRARAPSPVEPARAAIGLRRVALGLWVHGAMVALEVLGIFVLAAQGLFDLNSLEWITPVAAIATGAPIIFAVAGALTAADAGVERRWLLAAGTIAFVSLGGRVDGGWLGFAVGIPGPVMLTVALVRIARAGHGIAIAGVAIFVGVSIAAKLLTPDFDLDRLVLLYGIMCAEALARLVALVLIGQVARLAAARVEHDPRALDRVFA